MGANVSTNIANNVQEVQDSLMQETNQTCQATCSNVSKGQAIEIIGSHTGNIDLSQKCVVDSSCVMSQALNTSISDILTSLSKQKIDTDQAIFPNLEIDANTNSSTITQRTSNMITQIMTTNCQATSENIKNDQLIYIQSSVTGNINATQSGSARSQCAMNNMAKNVLLNKVMSDNDQTSVSKTALGMIASAIFLCAIIGAIGFLFVKMSGKKKK